MPGNDGTGRAYGVELYLARQARLVDRSCERLVVLHLGARRDDGVWTNVRVRLRSPARAEPRRQLSLSRLIELGTTVRVQSGFPYSKPLGVRVAAVEDTGDSDGDGNTTELIPQRDAVGLPVWTADYGDSSNLNSGRLPVFARVDLRATFRPRWQNSRWQLYVEVINLLNRDNAGTLDTELVYDPDFGPPARDHD